MPVVNSSGITGPFREVSGKIGEVRIGNHLTDGEGAPDSRARYEPLDVPAFLPFWLGCLIMLFVGGVLLWIAIEFPVARHQEYRGPMKSLPPMPRLQSAPTGELQRYEMEKTRELEATGRARGKRLPIDEAMRATAREGWGSSR